jgi:hypothetical protein
MAKKAKHKPAKKIVYTKKSQGINKAILWFGAIVLIFAAAVAMTKFSDQSGENPLIMELGDPTALNQWEFNSPSEISKTGWNAVIAGTPKYCLDSKGEKNKECDDGTPGQAIKLTVNNGNLEFGSSKVGYTTELRNNNLNFSMPADVEAIVVEVKMKATFANVVTKKAVTTNKAKLEISNVMGKGLTKTASVTLGANGEAVYAFRFTKAEMANQYIKGKFSNIVFWPTAMSLQLTNVAVDRISILGEVTP